MKKKKKKVVIVGMIRPYLGNDADVWCINWSWQRQMHRARRTVDRIYFFDHLGTFEKTFVDDNGMKAYGFADQVNALGPETKIIASQAYPEIPRCEPYPYDEITSHFSGIHYFSCTAAYMVAQAIYEQYTHITLCGCYWTHDSAEYMLHKPCMEFWLGMAVGSGRVVELLGSDNQQTQLLRPWPWDTARYGYVVQRNLANQTGIMAAAYRACLAMPCEFSEAANMSESELKAYADEGQKISRLITEAPKMDREPNLIPKGESDEPEHHSQQTAGRRAESAELPGGGGQRVGIDGGGHADELPSEDGLGPGEDRGDGDSGIPVHK